MVDVVRRKGRDGGRYELAKVLISGFDTIQEGLLMLTSLVARKEYILRGTQNYKVQLVK